MEYWLEWLRLSYNLRAFFIIRDEQIAFINWKQVFKSVNKCTSTGTQTQIAHIYHFPRTPNFGQHSKLGVCLKVPNGVILKCTSNIKLYTNCTGSIIQQNSNKSLYCDFSYSYIFYSYTSIQHWIFLIMRYSKFLSDIYR